MIVRDAILVLLIFCYLFYTIKTFSKMLEAARRMGWVGLRRMIVIVVSAIFWPFIETFIRIRRLV